jgi:hypothetical protein
MALQISYDGVGLASILLVRGGTGNSHEDISSAGKCRMKDLAYSGSLQ